MTHQRLFSSILAAAALFLGVGCGGSAQDPGDSEPTRIENAVLGLAIEALPAAFTVALNRGEALALEAVGVPGRIEVTVGPPIGSVNLIDELKQHQADIEGRPDGAYAGQTELIAQLGRVYVSRGRFTGEDGALTEEYKAIGLHPLGDRALYLTYRYPAGDDSAERGQALVELVGELVPLETEPAGAT